MGSAGSRPGAPAWQVCPGCCLGCLGPVVSPNTPTPALLAHGHPALVLVLEAGICPHTHNTPSGVHPQARTATRERAHTDSWACPRTRTHHVGCTHTQAAHSPEQTHTHTCGRAQPHMCTHGLPQLDPQQRPVRGCFSAHRSWEPPAALPAAAHFTCWADGCRVL